MYWYGRLRPLQGELRKGRNDSPIRTRPQEVTNVSVVLGPVTLRIETCRTVAGSKCNKELSVIWSEGCFSTEPPPPTVSAPALVDWGHTSAEVLVDRWNDTCTHVMHTEGGGTLCMCVSSTRHLKGLNAFYSLFCSFQGQVIHFVAPVW